MEKKLPARPNIEHLRGQSKALLAEAKSGRSEAITLFAEHHPSAKLNDLGLSDAQLVVARKHGFASWPRLVHYLDEVQRLDAVWEFTSLEVDGNQLPNPGARGARIMMDGVTFRMVDGGAKYEGLFHVDVESTPHTIDIDFINGEHAGRTAYGIYQVDGDTLTICLGLVGVPRPAEFSSRAGGGVALETLRKVGPAERLAKEPDQPTGQIPIGNADDFKEVTPEHERLQGEWSAVAITRDGMPLPDTFARHGRRIVDGTLTTVKFGPEVWMEALTRIDASQIPVAIDYLLTTGPSEGQIQLGICRWNGDDAETCFAEPGLPRPDEFSSRPGSGRTLSLWRGVAPHSAPATG